MIDNNPEKIAPVKAGFRDSPYCQLDASKVTGEFNSTARIYGSGLFTFVVNAHGAQRLRLFVCMKSVPCFMPDT